MKKNILMMGGSRGISEAVAKHFCEDNHVICVSRTHSQYGQWMQTDIRTQEGIETIEKALSNRTLDAFLYLGGTWEDRAFTQHYSFEKSSREEIHRVVDVNLTSAILLTQALLPFLERAENPKAIFVGALSGLDNNATKEVANTASKFGLRGFLQSIRLTHSKIGFSIINPGNIATEEVLEDIREGRFKQQHPIPMADFVNTVNFILNTSFYCVVSEIDLRQK